MKTLNFKFLKSWRTGLIYFLAYVVASIVISIPIAIIFYAGVVPFVTSAPLWVSAIFNVITLTMVAWLSVWVCAYFLNKYLIIKNLHDTILFTTALNLLVNLLNYLRDIIISFVGGVHLTDNIFLGILFDTISLVLFYYFSHKYLRGKKV